MAPIDPRTRDVSNDGRVRRVRAGHHSGTSPCGLARARSEGKRLGRPQRIRKALATRGRPGVRVIAKRFGVDAGTVQRISRPFDGASAVAA
jgi:hypothetical protein